MLKNEYYAYIRAIIEEQILLGERKFILFPFGEQGMLVKRILNEVFGIQEICIMDNYLFKLNPNIKHLSWLKREKYKCCKVLITSNNPNIYEEIRHEISQYIESDQIVDIFEKIRDKKSSINKNKPKVGKYSYGPLCNHRLVESIGAFCSFAELTDVVLNHPVHYISTHPFLYQKTDKNFTGDMRWYFEGVKPIGKMYKSKKVIIGNDVWLGKNVVITNGANIGNGVIAGAGAIITKDIPDYAIVGGVPAQIIRYRYSQEQIDNLNKIEWWNWPDEKIRECYADFYDDIDIFIEKHIKK